MEIFWKSRYFTTTNMGFYEMEIGTRTLIVERNGKTSAHASLRNIVCLFPLTLKYEKLMHSRLPEKPEQLAMFKLVSTDDRTQVMERNKMVAFVQEGMLYTIEPDGNSKERCEINHRSEIIGKYLEIINPVQR